MDGLCFSLYPIILVINLIFNDVTCIYFSVSFYSIAFIANHTSYRSVFSTNAGKYVPEQLQIRTLFTQSVIPEKSDHPGKYWQLLLKKTSKVFYEAFEIKTFFDKLKLIRWNI